MDDGCDIVSVARELLLGVPLLGGVRLQLRSGAEEPSWHWYGRVQTSEAADDSLIRWSAGAMRADFDPQNVVGVSYCVDGRRRGVCMFDEVATTLTLWCTPATRFDRWAESTIPAWARCVRSTV